MKAPMVPRAITATGHSHAGMAPVLLLVSSSALGGDMPAFGAGAFWSELLAALLFGLPYTAVLYPAIVLVPAFLFRAVFIRSRKQDYVDDAKHQYRSRRWRIWTLVSLVPWVLFGLLVLADSMSRHS